MEREKTNFGEPWRAPTEIEENPVGFMTEDRAHHIEHFLGKDSLEVGRPGPKS